MFGERQVETPHFGSSSSFLVQTTELWAVELASKVRGSLKVDLLRTKSGWPLRVKAMRAAWEPFSWLLRLPLGKHFSVIRVLLLRIFGAKIGSRVLVHGGVRVWCPWNLRVGDFSAIAWGVEIYNLASVEIGSMTVVSQYSYLCAATHDFQSPVLDLTCIPIVIKDQVWIAAKSTVLPGVTIEQGVVVGACSVVTRNVPAWTVVAGNPARVLRAREMMV
ncbi:putative colanic acid biosynthesis acetyltransferase [Caenimonas sedimenti]|uniref:Putative colanic acid biosynthesis acetyltransferase n=1 Tax=Caenimonas sedimenti TaxID=2596921 RepID=A0A562ZVU4_9BURK|nr:putative colanic acid biosynthesis acetyltransferase [Caenimonas sedimenti]